MIPFDRAAELYDRFPQPRKFDEDMCAHLSTGYVVSTPEYFIMGRGVDRFSSRKLIIDPWHCFPKKEQNAWMVWIFVGSSRNFLSFVPYSLEWVMWSRRGNSLRVYEFEKIKRKCESTILL